MFDIQLFTEITYGSHGGTAVVGDKLEGASSGATGIVAYDDNSDGIYLHSVVEHSNLEKQYHQEVMVTSH